jgi:hypothetical protein
VLLPATNIVAEAHPPAGRPEKVNVYLNLNFLTMLNQKNNIELYISGTLLLIS